MENEAEAAQTFRDSDPLTLPASNVTVLGAFNPAIIQPPWLSKVVFGARGDYEVLVAAAGGGPVLQRRNNITWWVQPDRLVAASSPISLAATFVKKVLETLHHTPVKAVGINFRVEALLPLTGPWFSKLLDLRSSGEFLRGKMAVSVVLRAARADNSAVNVTIQEAGLPQVSLDLNFHRSAVAQDEGDRVTELIAHIDRASSFEAEVATIKAEICHE